MGQRSIKSSPELAKLIKLRRNELNLTIEEAAARAGVGTKTWSRYEAGEAIRRDKGKGICKALKWNTLPGEEPDRNNIYTEYEVHEAWSKYLAEDFGKAAALSFAVGSDILLDHLQEDMEALASMPAGSHIGQIETSFLAEMLPRQFLIRYDYEFLYALFTIVCRMRMIAHGGNSIVAHSVLEELVLYLIVKEADFIMESMDHDSEAGDEEPDYNWDEWIYDILGDMDIVSCLYSDIYLTEDHNYHFKHWMKEQFYSN